MGDPSSLQLNLESSSGSSSDPHPVIDSMGILAASVDILALEPLDELRSRKYNRSDQKEKAACGLAAARQGASGPIREKLVGARHG
jgi:hypothetical protein